MIKNGEEVPNFSGKTNQGIWELEKYRGKKIIVYFYPRDNTPGCTTESNDFNDNISFISEKNTEIVGISNDSLAKHQKFCEKFDFQFPLIADEDKKISESFGVYQLKKFMGKESMGIVRSTFLIDEEGKLLKEWRKVKVKGHVEEVLTML